MNGPNKLERCITLSMKDSPETNTLAQWAHSQAMRKRKCYEHVFDFPLCPSSFSLQLTNGPNKLECYITLGMKDSPERNTLAQWAHSQVMRKRKCCEHVFHFALFSILIFFATYEWV
jgi:hypothetical protein